MNEEMLKNLSGAIDVAIKELVAVDSLQKNDKVSLQDAKLRPDGETNGTLPGDNRGETALKPEDAKKAEAAAKTMPDNEVHSGKTASIDPTKGGEAAKKAEDGKDDKKDKDGKKDKEKDDDDDDDMDDDKAAKLKARLEKYETKKKTGMPMAGAGAMLSKSEVEEFQEQMTKKLRKAMKKAAKNKVEEMAKSMGDRLSAIEAAIQKVATAPQPRQSVSGLSPLVKSEADAAGAASSAATAGGTTLSKGEVLDKLFTLQKSGDTRVDSQVIARVDVGDYSVLAEKNINLK